MGVRLLAVLDSPPLGAVAARGPSLVAAPSSRAAVCRVLLLVVASSLSLALVGLLLLLVADESLFPAVVDLLLPEVLASPSGAAVAGCVLAPVDDWSRDRGPPSGEDLSSEAAVLLCFAYATSIFFALIMDVHDCLPEPGPFSVLPLDPVAVPRPPLVLELAAVVDVVVVGLRLGPPGGQGLLR